MVQAQLKVLSGPLAGSLLEIDSYAVVLGRSSDATFDLTGYTELSRQHATIRWDGTGWLIEDQNSKNGTEVDGKTVQLGRLVSGSVIHLGDFEAEFLADSLGKSGGTGNKVRHVRNVSNTVFTGVLLLCIVVGTVAGAKKLIIWLTHRPNPHKIVVPKNWPTLATNSSTTPYSNPLVPGGVTVNPAGAPPNPTFANPSIPNTPIHTGQATTNEFNTQAVILQQDLDGNWFRVGAGTVLNSTTVLVAATEVKNLARKLTDVEVLTGSSAPFTKQDVPASSILLHGDVARITLPKPVLLSLPQVSQVTNLLNTTVTIALLDQDANSTTSHLQQHPVIANYYLEPGTKFQTLSGFEVNYHNQYNYLGAPVFDLNSNLIGMIVGTRQSETYNHKLVAYGYNLGYLQNW